MDDGDSFSADVAGGVPLGASLSNEGGGAYVFTWSPASVADVRAINFLITDSGNAVTLLNPQLEVCPCGDDGECTIETVLDRTTPIIIMGCICSEGEWRVFIVGP